MYENHNLISSIIMPRPWAAPVKVITDDFIFGFAIKASCGTNTRNISPKLTLNG